MAYHSEEIKAGLIIVLAFAILSGFVILIGGSQAFAKYDTYTIRVLDAAGIEEGAQVKLGGVRIGRVQAVIPPAAPGEPIIISLGVKQGTPLYQGTKAAISQVGLMGDIYIQLAINGVDQGVKARFRPGETIPVTEQVQLAAMMARLNRISESVEGVVKDLGRVFKDVDLIFSDQNVKEVASLLRNANTAIVSGSSRIDQIAASVKGSTGRLERTLTEVEGLARETRAEVAPLLARARGDLDQAGQLIRSLEQTSKSTTGTMLTADRVIDRQSRNLDRLSQALIRTSEELRDTLNEIRNKPWSVLYKENRGGEER